MTSLSQLGHQPKTETHLCKERSGSSRNPRKINGKTEETKLKRMRQKRQPLRENISQSTKPIKSYLK
ncbi:hypothetical protein SynSYN20_02197 [Synechococcus sp. SYN20]|nr:hypothetical protein SynSYN20_02197 [Synechococcus sp. SYN20]